MSILRQDVPFAARMLRRSPGFTTAAVIAIALGVGANAAIFTVIEHVLLQPLPYPRPDRLVNVNEVQRGAPSAVSPPNFMDWRAQNGTLQAIGAYNEATLTLSGGSEAVRLEAAMIDAEVLRVLGAGPAIGRAFTAGDTRPGARPVVLLGSGVWQRVYGGNASVVGRTITLEGEPYEVVGVMPPGFEFPEHKDAWVPLTLTPKDLGDNQRGAHYLSAVGRLKDGVGTAQARADLDRIEQGIARRFPSKVGGNSMLVEPLLESMVGSVQRSLWILFGAVGFLLLIACVNVSNLLLARATTRTGEIAVRSALGASRARLVRQLLAESVVLALAGGAAGMLLATWGVRALMAVAPADLPRAGAIQIDGSVIAFSLLLAAITGIAFGTAPALMISRPDLTVFLKDAGRDGSTPSRRRRFRSVLVAAQVALALVLLAGAGLAARSFGHLVGVDPGFRTSGVLTFDIALPEATYPSLPSQAQFFREYIERVQQQHEMRSAGAVSFAPLTPAGFGGSFSILDRPGEAEGNAQIRSATPGYIETVAIPLRAGRLFDAHDNETGSRVAIVSEATARKFWPGEIVVGKRIRLHVNEPTNLPREIVGVVADVHLHRLDVAAAPVIYVPHAQYGPETMTVMARTSGDPLQAVAQLKAVLTATGPGVAMGRAETLDDLASASVAEPRFRAVLLAVFGVVSLALAAVGLYGVVAFSVSQRRTELGLRMALGADPSGVLLLVLRQGMTPVAIGIGIGLGGAAVLARVMRSLLFETDAADPVTFAAVAAALALVALIACYIPARRATRLDPALTLR